MALLEIQNVTRRFGDFSAVDNVSIGIEAGEFFTLLGPSGCGKTTLLRMIAGFDVPDGGRVLLNGEDLAGRPPERRPMRMVFQSYALFPHMTAIQNVAFGMQLHKVGAAERRKRAGEMLDLVGLSAHMNKYATQMSGGQQQRVALARALAIEPKVLLLDEPLSALDAKLRQELRFELKQILQAAHCTTLIVTHDQEEAMSLADEIIVMDRGRILQQGNAAAIYHSPRTRAVAEFIGRTNWFEGKMGAAVGPDLRELITAEGCFVVPAGVATNGTSAQFCVRPERLRILAADQSSVEGLNLLQGTLVSAAYLGSEIHHAVVLDSGRTVICVEQNRDQAIPVVGTPLRIAFRPVDCILAA